MRHSSPLGLPASELSNQLRHPSEEFSDHDRLRRIRRHGSSRRGRFLLALFLALLVILDLAFYLGGSPTGKQWIPAFVIIDVIWMVALFAGVWFRQKWARFVLATVLLVYAFVALLFASELLEIVPGVKSYALATVALASGSVRAVCGAMLIAWRDFKRLTSRSDCG